MKTIQAKKISDAAINDSEDFSNPTFYASWFVDDVNDLMESGNAKSVDEAVKMTEKNIRALFESALKQGRTSAVQTLNRKK